MSEEIILANLYNMFPNVDHEVIQNVFHEHASHSMEETVQMLQVMEQDQFSSQYSINDGRDSVYIPRNDEGMPLYEEPQTYPNHDSDLVDQVMEEAKQANQGPPMEGRQSVVPKDPPPSITLSDSLFREILLFMRVQLKSDQQFFATIRVIHKILKNIIDDPTNPKYHKLRLSNDTLKKTITQQE